MASIEEAFKESEPFAMGDHRVAGADLVRPILGKRVLDSRRIDGTFMEDDAPAAARPFVRRFLSIRIDAS